MAMSVGEGADTDPIMDMNTTPLIDVMLVLLVMFIITIPIQTHAIKVDLPVNNPNPPPVTIKPDINKLSVDPSNQILWNGAPIDEATLRTYLDRTRAMDPQPELHVQPDPQSRYEITNRVLAVIKKSEVGKMGFVGNEQYQAFGKE
jgi:biopolymer transport protein ExbD